VVGEGTGWYHVGYSCISSTCKQYQAGVKQSDLIMSALGDATVVVPLVQQAKECIGKGNAEACGGLAAGAFMGVFSLKSKKGKAIEEQLIREQINRPAGGPKAFDAAKADVAAGRKPKAKDEAATKAPEKNAKPGDDALAAKFKPVKTAETLRMEEAVHAAAKQAGSEVKMGGEKHGIFAWDKKGEAGFQFCTSCALLSKKLAELEAILPPGSELRTKVTWLKGKATGLDTAYQKGQLKKHMVNQAAKDLAADLKKDVIKDPFIERLLDMSPADLRKHRAKLTKEAAAHPLINDTQAARDARAQASRIDKDNAARNADKLKKRVDSKSDKDAEKAFGDLESWTAGKTSLSTAPKRHPTKQDHTLNIDERNAVGEPNTGSAGGRDISMAERRDRALSLANREFKDAVTNQKTKGPMLEKAPARSDQAHPSVSLVDDHGALVGRRFSEIKEINIIGKRIKSTMKDKNKRRPGDLKEELNSKLWEEFKDPKSPEGRIVAQAIEQNGYGIVVVKGKYVLRALTDKQLRQRGLRWVDGQGYVRPLGSGQ
jgi:hypothetical protein